MKTLQSAVSAVLPDFTSLGDDGRNVNRERLTSVLDGLADDLKRTYWIRLAIALVVIVILIVLTLRTTNQPAILSALVGGMGITIAGGMAALKQVTDEMARVRLLLAIAPELSLEALTEIARKIATKL